MKRKQKSKEIDDTTYLVTQMSAVDALKVQTRLLKLIGPSVSKIKAPTGKAFDASAMMEIIEPLLEKVDDTYLFETIMMLFENGVMLQGKTDQGQFIPVPLDFKDHFAGKPLTMWKVVWFILDVNFNLGKLMTLSLPITPEGNLTKES